jgi:hypothetical protein
LPQRQGRDSVGGVAMWKMTELADRFVKTVSNVTVGTVIVLVHVALADRRPRLRVRERPVPRLPS